MKLILACDPQGGIGKDNSLPWPILEGDLPRFKKLTTDQVIVMGRNTWLSLPRKPLPNRLNFVVTSQQLELLPGAIAVKDLSHFKHFKNAWLIGGASLVNSSWDYMILSLI
jgi:dihydrofolate reductase